MNTIAIVFGVLAFALLVVACLHGFEDKVR